MSIAMITPQIIIPEVKATNLVWLISALLTQAATGFAGASSSSSFTSLSDSWSSFVGRA
jgi:hypothetical protein